MDESGRERERYPSSTGPRSRCKNGTAGQGRGPDLAEWDPYTIPILTEVSGRVKFGDIIEGETMQEQLDEVTGFSSKVIIESRDPEARPRISIKDETGKTAKIPGYRAMARYLLPVGANIVVTEGRSGHRRRVIAKIPRETTKTKDITGGLPRVAELFEARNRRNMP